MARVRRKSATRRQRIPGWLWLFFGLALGVSGVIVTQLVLKRAGARDGLAGLFAPAKPGSTRVKSAAEPDTPVTPKFDFYTVLPEVETVLPPRLGNQQADAREAGASYFLQAGSFAAYADADELKARLALNGLPAHVQKITIDGRGDFHRVRLGPYQDIDELDTTAERLHRLGVQPLRLKVKPEPRGRTK